MKARIPVSILLVSMLIISVLVTVAVAQKGISIQKAYFVSNVEAFGIYTEESSNRFQTGAQTVIYIEIADFMLKEKNGTYALNVALDFSILDSASKSLFEQTDVVVFERNFKSRLHDLFFKVDLGFEGWPAGEYTIVLSVRDDQAGLTSRTEMPVEIFE